MPTIRAISVSLLISSGLIASCSATPRESPTTPTPHQVVVSDAWVKATTSDMTGIFATISNTTATAQTVTGGTTNRAAEVELHQTIAAASGAMTMQKVSEFSIPAHRSMTLEPGGDHIMLIGVTQDILPGEEITVKLQLSDGNLVLFTAVAKEFAGGNEDYSTPQEPASR